MKTLIPTIGAEVHVELKTKAKVFSSSLNSYGEIANSKTNVIDLGYPGTLPILNKEVIDLAIKTAIVLNCKIQKKMYFDRKNYFYPDLPKGYQITQSSTPIGYDGYVEIDNKGNKKKIEIERIHIEEDTSKSIHRENETLLDFNRAGIPLIEIVTKPVIENEEEAVLYLEKLREILLYANISDVKIEEGSMRCDINISLKEKISKTLGIKTEVKNIGSINSVKEAIIYEIKRQKELINNNKTLKKETRRYDEKQAATILMRVKESINDYRYFPEPDIPYIEINEEWVNQLRKTIPLLPDELKDKYSKLEINNIAINTLMKEKQLLNFLEDVLEKVNPIISANLLTGDVLAYLKKHMISIEDTKLNKDNFIVLVNKLESKELSSKIGKEILNELFINGGKVENIIKQRGLNQINNSDELIKIINNVINNNSKAIDDYKKGYDKALKYLVGQIMKETKGQANPIIVNKLLKEKLDNI